VAEAHKTFAIPCGIKVCATISALHFYFCLCGCEKSLFIRMERGTRYVSRFAYIYIYVHIYNTCMYIYMYIHICIYTYTCICIYICTHLYMCAGVKKVYLFEHEAWHTVCKQIRIYIHIYI